MDKLILHHDQDPVCTSFDWTGRLLNRDRVHVSYMLYGAKYNRELETFINRCKNENRSLLLDAPAIEKLRNALDEQMLQYNEVRRHSRLGYVPPWTYLKQWLQAVTKGNSGRTSVLEDHART